MHSNILEGHREPGREGGGGGHLLLPCIHFGDTNKGKHSMGLNNKHHSLTHFIVSSWVGSEMLLQISALTK